VAIDRDVSGLADIDDPALTSVAADLEDGSPFPVAGQQFAGVVCTNYLHRPLLPAIVAAVASGGVLIYETFTEGHQQFGRPTRPDFLLQPGELRAAVAGRLHVVAEEELVVPGPARVQRICARRPAGHDVP
jgi:hypothetical protein